MKNIDKQRRSRKQNAVSEYVMNLEVSGISLSLHSQQRSDAVCTWMLIRAMNSLNVISHVHRLLPGTTVGFS